MIHPLALVEPGARVAADATVGPFAVVESGAEVGPGCELAAHAVIRSPARLGSRVRVDSFAVVGGDPQDLSFDRSSLTLAEVGDGSVLREHVTVHRGTAATGTTKVGSGCLLMAGSHVAHDCRVGDGAILANGCMLGGHVEVGDRAFISGGVAVHQFCRVGEGSMTSGNAVVTGDIPPFALAHGRDELAGLNLVGLRRQGLPATTIAELKHAYRLAYADGLSCADAARAALVSSEVATPEARRFLEFFLGGRRGRFAQPSR